ncbi:hypothetical protein CR513_38778, partial [Mucuna pruriens]
MYRTPLEMSPYQINIDHTRQSKSATWLMTKQANKGSFSCRNWRSFAWKPTKTPNLEKGVLSRPKSATVQLSTKAHTRSSTNPLYAFNPEIEKTLRRLRKARNLVVNNSRSSDSVINSN